MEVKSSYGEATSCIFFFLAKKSFIDYIGELVEDEDVSDYRG